MREIKALKLRLILAPWESPGQIIEGEEIRFGIDFTPMSELAHLPVKLEPEVIFYDGREPKFSSSRYFSVLEVLNAIYWEISFFGDPKEKADLREELQDRVREATNLD